MRIVSGRLKGRRLVSFKAPHIRPTTDRVKESIFNKLIGEFNGTRVIDLYAGTGSLGLEAWSRGSQFVTFVENHRKSLGILKKNLQTLEIPGADYEVVSQDVIQFCVAYNGPTADVILIDPPFTKALADSTLNALVGGGALGEGGLVVIESAQDELIQDEYGPISLLDRKDFGDKRLSFFVKS